MAKQKEYDVEGLIVRIVLAGAVAAISLNSAGCGEQMDRIEENQLILQTMVEANAQQIAAIASDIEQNQHRLEIEIKGVQNNTQKLTTDVTAVGDLQIKLHEIVQDNNREMTNKVVAIEQKQYGLENRIEQVHNSTQKVAADVAAVGNEQMKLHETLQSNNRQLTDKVVMIEQNQQKWQITIEGMQLNIQSLADGIVVLEQNLLKLQEIFQNKMREFVSMLDVSSQGLLEFQERIQNELETLSYSVGAIEKSQAKLHKQIIDVQSSTETLSSNIPEALEQIKEELSREGPEKSEILEIESLPSIAPALEINRVD